MFEVGLSKIVCGVVGWTRVAQDGIKLLLLIKENFLTS
jgi:hypothetical protein